MAVVAPRRALLIVNPASRRGGATRDVAVRAFGEAGVACDVRITARAGDAARWAAELGGAYGAVFALGGDGTVMEVVQALRGGPIPVGVLPGGTGNLVARALGIPLSVAAAVRTLLAGGVTEIDLGDVGEGRHFAFAAGIGIDAVMIAETSEAAKRRFGVWAYAATAMRSALAVEHFDLTATVDGVSYRYRATAAMVANFGSVLGGMLHLGPGIQENDGMLDLCVFSPANARDAVRVGWRMLRHDFRTDPAMHFHRGRTLRLETAPGRAVQADGELLPAGALHVRVVPRAARLLVPSGRR